MSSELSRNPDPIVVTGMGAVSPLGTGVETNWARLTAGKSGIVRNTRFDVSNFGAKIAGLVPTKATIRRASIRWSPSTPRTSRRWTCSSSTVWSPRRKRWRSRAGWPDTPEKQAATATIIGTGRRRLAGDGRGGRDHHREGPAAAVAVHRADLSRQSRGRAGSRSATASRGRSARRSPPVRRRPRRSATACG